MSHRTHSPTTRPAPRRRRRRPGCALERLDPRLLLDALPPTASASGSTLNAEATVETITVFYSDTDGINAATLGSDDIKVTGPNGYAQVATYLTQSGTGTFVTATYQVTGPAAGAFTQSGNGTYHIFVQDGAVQDSVGNATALTEIGNFTVAIPIAIKSPTSPITRITVGAAGAFQVRASQFSSGQFFSPSSEPGRAGLVVRIPGAGGIPTTYGFLGQSFTAGAQVISPDGNAVTTTYTAGTLLSITEVTQYVPGDEFFHNTFTFANATSAPLAFDAFFLADLYLADSDSGVGFYNPDTGAIGGTDATGKYNIFFQGDPAAGPSPSAYEEGRYSTVFAVATGSSTHFNNSVKLPTTAAPYNTDPAFEDNGAGLEWQGLSASAGGSRTIGVYAAFGNITAAGQSGSVSGSLGTISPPAYGDLTVDVPILLTGTGGIDATSLGDDDILASGPDGYSAVGKLIASTPTDGGALATYRFPSPDGGFLDTNNGTFSLSFIAGNIASTSGVTSQASTIGTFTTSVTRPILGGPVGDFGSGGVVQTFVPDAAVRTLGATRNADGTLITAGYDAASNTLILTRLLDNGQIDATFGDAGFLHSPLPANFTPARVQVTDSSIYLLGATADAGLPAVTAYSLAGAANAAFGSGGVLVLPTFKAGDRADAFTAVPGKAPGYLVGGAIGGAATILLLKADGTQNTKFGLKGAYAHAGSGPLDSIGSFALGAKGVIFASGTTSSGSAGDGSLTSLALVVKLSAAGKPDKSFNKTGEATYGPAGYALAAGQKVIAQADGKALLSLSIATSAASAQAGLFGAAVLRLTAKGAPDPTFGNGGLQVTRVPAATLLDALHRYRPLSIPTAGQAGSVTDILTAPNTLVELPGGKVRQIAADEAGDGTTLTETQLVADALDLVATTLTLSAKKPYKPNAPVAASVAVSNTGTLAAPATVPVQVYLSTDGSLDITRDTLIGTIPVKVALKPGASKTIKIPFKSPGATGTYFLFARIDAGTGAAAELTLGNNLAAPSTSIDVTSNGKPAAEAIHTFTLPDDAPTTPILRRRRGLFSADPIL